MIAIISKGDRTAHLQLPVERKQLAGALSYPYSDYIDLVGSKRVDVHDQIMLNWNAFVDYVWSQQ